MIRTVMSLSSASALFMLSALPSLAANLTVRVTGIAQQSGEIGCALHANGAAFPTGQANTRTVWTKATASSVQCRFEGVASGSYAVAISHDLNGNRKTDTNFVRMPTEAWGVSNNVRPTLRAPRFDEALFVMDTQDRTITVRIQR